MKIEDKDRGYMNESGRYSDLRHFLNSTSRSYWIHDDRKRGLEQYTNREIRLADYCLADDTLSEHEETD
eukprot:3305403-Heterocapsa_arctica.AAC.1